MELFFQALPGISQAVLVPLLIWIFKKLADWIAAKVKNEALSGVLVKLSAAVRDAVLSTQQTYVDRIREGLADGKLTQDEKDEAKRRAIEHVKTYLGEHGLRELGNALHIGEDQVAAVVSSAIEAEVKANSPKP